MYVCISTHVRLRDTLLLVSYGHMFVVTRFRPLRVRPLYTYVYFCWPSPGTSSANGDYHRWLGEKGKHKIHKSHGDCSGTSSRLHTLRANGLHSIMGRFVSLLGTNPIISWLRIERVGVITMRECFCPSQNTPAKAWMKSIVCKTEAI